MQAVNVSTLALSRFSILKVFLYFLILCFFPQIVVAENEVSTVRMWHAPDNTRIVFDLKAPVEHQIFSLQSPDRLVIDLKNIVVKTDVSKLELKDSQINLIRGAVKDTTDYRIVLDLKSVLTPQSFVLPPNEKYGHRLVIDLFYKAKTVVKTEKELAPQSGRGARDVVIAIDAGHGGEDPGAIGPRKEKEKEIVLQIAKKLQNRLKKNKGINPVLIRTGDYYLSLSERPKIAKKKYNADIFLSIHADAFTDPRAHGSSIYALSRKGASSATAGYLADKENKSDLIGGVRIDDKESMVKNVIVDLTMEGSLEQSIFMGDRMLSKMKGVGDLHKSRVEQAAFRVLKSPDMVSVLIETGFISNPAEAKRLSDSNYQQKLTEAIAEGLENYLKQYPIEGSYFAELKEKNIVHIVGKGDTLSSIANRYGVSLLALRRANNISSDQIKTGQKIKIPGA
jgi:N-acetylmuramoyl-L-alanine amidase